MTPDDETAIPREREMTREPGVERRTQRRVWVRFGRDGTTPKEVGDTPLSYEHDWIEFVEVLVPPETP